MAPRTLLGVFAHPDDESFGPGGTLAKYAREGVEVHVCIATDGASGSTEPASAGSGASHSLADVRKHELSCACDVLGVNLHILGYRDSGMEGSPDNRHPQSLYQADLDSVARQLVSLVERVKPQVVITHDPTGGYFHPDHIRVNHAVRRAWSLLRDAEPASDTNGSAGNTWTPQRLYYTVIPRSTLRWYLWLLRLQGQDPRHYGRQRDVDLTMVGVPDRNIHVRLNVGAYQSVKQEAGACHSSQGGGSRRWRTGPRWLRRRAMQYEYFVQAYPQPERNHNDLFAGLTGVG
jgi:LmbE family N-acetylglucosaminyl deacetylase